MSYEGNDLGYDSGYDLEIQVRGPAHSQPQHFSGESNLPSGYGLKADGLSGVASDAKYIPSDYSPGGTAGKVRAMKDGKVKEYDDEAAASKDGAGKITTELEGQQNGKFLVQYFDSDNKPIKYDEVDRGTAEKLGFSKDQLDKAPKIQNGSMAADRLKKLEGAKEESKTGVDLGADTPVMYAGEAKAANADSRWAEGGSYHDRLSKDYGYSKDDIAYIKAQYGTSPDLDKKFGQDGIFRPMTPTEKADTKLATVQSNASRQAVINDKIDADANKLMGQVNYKDAEHKQPILPGEPAYLSKDKAVLQVRQYYRESGFDTEKTPPNFNKFSSKETQDPVNKKIGEKGPGGVAAFDGVNGDADKAARSEKLALTQDLADAMPDKITKKVNGQDKEVKLSKEDKYMYAQLYVQEKTNKEGWKTAGDYHKERDRLKAQGSDQTKKDMKLYAESFHTDPQAETRFGELKNQVGIQTKEANLDPKKQAEIDYNAKKNAEVVGMQDQAKFKEACRQYGIDPNAPDAKAQLDAKEADKQAQAQGKSMTAQKKAEFEQECSQYGVDPKDKNAGQKLAAAKKKADEDMQTRSAFMNMGIQSILADKNHMNNMIMENYRASIAFLQKTVEAGTPPRLSELWQMFNPRGR